MALLKLPEDIFLLVADHLRNGHLNALVKTCWDTYAKLERHLYRRNNNPEAAFKYAVRKDYPWTMRKIVRYGAHERINDDTYQRYMPYVVGKDLDEILRILIMEDIVDPHAYLECGYWPLMNSAARYGSHRIVKLLLALGVDPLTEIKPWATTPFEDAVWGRSPKCVKLLLPHSLGLVNKKANGGHHYGLTPILYAIQMNYKNVVEILLKEPTLDMSLADHLGNTPLMYAMDKPSIFSLILQRRDIAITATNGDDQTALSRLLWTGRHKQIRELLARHDVDASVNIIYPGMNRTVLNLAIKEGLPRSIIQMLISKSTNLSEPDIELNTPACLAAMNNRIDVLQILIQKGVDLDEKGQDENTPLMFAAKMERVGIARRLLDHGVRLDLVNRYGFSALQLAMIAPSPVSRQIQRLIENAIAQQTEQAAG